MPNNNNDSKNRCQYGKITKDDITALQGAGGAELLIYMSLAIHAWNDDRIAFPTSRTIQELTGLSRSSVKRGLSKLRERKAIIEVGKTNIGSIKYRLGGTTFDTRPKSETRPTFDTPTSPKSETPGVQDMTPIKLKKNNNTQNIKASDADENDVHMFVELWNKWNGHCLCDWESMNPIQEYKSMKAVVLQKWKQHRSNKDLSFELQVCDIYIMQKLVSLGKEFSGPARFWSGSKWGQGLLKCYRAQPHHIWEGIEKTSFLIASKWKMRKLQNHEIRLLKQPTPLQRIRITSCNALWMPKKPTKYIMTTLS